MGKKKLFISYSRNDLAFVTRLVDALRKEGETVWFDSHIRSGTQWDNTIENEIRKADVLITVLSDASVVSANVMDEVSLAIDLEKTIIPIKIRQCDVPMRLRRYQYVDFTEDQQWAFDKLMEDINENPEREPVRRRKKKEPQKRTPLVPFLIGGAVIVVLILIIGVFANLGGNTDDSEYIPDPSPTGLFEDEEFIPDSSAPATTVGMVIYQNPMGQVTVNKAEGGYPQVGDRLYALTPLEVYTQDRYANGDYIAVGEQIEVLTIYPVTQDGFIFLQVRYAERDF